MPRTATAKVTKASSNPVIRSNVIDSTQEKVGQDVPRVLKSTGPASEALSPADNSQKFDRIMPGGGIDLSGLKPEMTKAERLAYKRAHDQEYQENLKFYAEFLEIYIPPTTDKNEPTRFPVETNTGSIVFERGKTYTVRRNVVEILARCKKTSYTQRDFVNAEGIQDSMQVPTTGLAFNFQVTRDDNPRGKEWLRWTLAQP